MTDRLFLHIPHPHIPANANELHKYEQAASGFNRRLAIGLTKFVGSMPCAYLFLLIALIGFPGLFGSQVSTYVQWTSQTLIQLTMLSVIMVGQSVIGRKQELQADATFEDTEKTYHEIGQIALHLDAQDREILRNAQSIEEMSRRVNQLIRRIDQATNRGAA